MPQPDNALHGVLVVDKPGLAPGDGIAALSNGQATGRLPTSHDVVQLVRRWSGQRRIGHTGTLDPMASGVLVLCLGDATRLAEYYQHHSKRYWAEIVLGRATDTYDATGQVVMEAPIPHLDREAVEQALAGFHGAVLQSPPAFSALKRDGETLYRKARRGETVILSPRPVTFYSLELLAWQGGRLTLRVRCSAGAYIRSLAHDLGLALGSCGHLAALRREGAGPFTLEDAHTLQAVHAAANDQRLTELLMPAGWGLDLPRLHVDARTLVRLGHGQTVVVDAIGAPDDLAQVLDAGGRLAGIAICRGPAGGGTFWKAEKWFSVL